MKIAIVSDDMKTISMHFGRAKHYLVVTVENGKIFAQDSRLKMSNNNLFGEQQGHAPETHDTDSQSEIKIAKMAAPIIDCDVLLARGMDRTAYTCLQIRSIQVIITAIRNVQAAVDAYLAGDIINHLERLHEQ